MLTNIFPTKIEIINNFLIQNEINNVYSYIKKLTHTDISNSNTQISNQVNNMQVEVGNISIAIIAERECWNQHLGWRVDSDTETNVDGVTGSGWRNTPHWHATKLIQPTENNLAELKYEVKCCSHDKLCLCKA